MTLPADFTPPLGDKGRQYFVLRRRDTGKYVALQGYATIHEGGAPFGPLSKLATARDHRIRMFQVSPDLGAIDIVTILVKTTVADVFTEDEVITSRLTALCAYDDGVIWVKAFEKAVRDDALLAAMRYAIICDEVSKEMLAMIKTIADVVYRGRCLLACGDGDLMVVKMHCGGDMRMVYDFQEERMVVGATKSSVRGKVKVKR